LTLRFYDFIINSMKRIVAIGIVSLLLSSCAPVLDRQLMREGQRNVSFDELRSNPDAYRGKLFILGGLIVETRFTEQGSQLEVLSVPVDSSGYLKESERSNGRFLAVYPKSKALLDPIVYKKRREVTLAGEFREIRKGKIDEMEYEYPVFEIRQIYLFEEQQYYNMYPYPYYPYPYWYNPYWGPWPPPAGMVVENRASFLRAEGLLCWYARNDERISSK
jgi:outer membrane lipoprotein